MMEPLTRARGGLTDWRFTVGVVSGGHLLSHFYKLAFPPLFPLMRPEFGLSNVQLGLLITAAGVGSFLQMPIGFLVDRLGGKRLFLVAVGLTSLGVMLAGVGTTYVAILAFTVLSGLGQAAFHPSGYTLLAAATEGDREGKSFSVHTFGGHAGAAIAPLVFGGIGFAYGWRTALLVTGAFGLVYTVFVALVMDPVHRKTADFSDAEKQDRSLDVRGILSGLFQPTILALAVLFALLGMASSSIKTFTPVLSIEMFGLGQGAANASLTAFFVAAAVSVLVGGVLADRYSPHGLIAANAVIAALLTWGIVSGLVPVSPAAIIAFFAVLGLFVGMINPARDRLVNTLSGSGATGMTFGLAFTGGTVGATVAPVVVGAVIDAGTPRLAFLFIGGFFLVAAALIGTMGVRSARTTPQPAD